MDRTGNPDEPDRAGDLDVGAERYDRYTDPAVTQAEYATEAGLEARRSIYTGSSGPDPREVVLGILDELRPESVLEVGCGPGELAAEIAATVTPEVVAVDSSPRMVALARERGVDARSADVQDLPFPDDSFEVAVAAWVLYHVPDLARGLDEIVRVLRPGGHLVAVTNSDQHLQPLWSLIGLDAYPFPFSAENGAARLASHFASVERQDVTGTVTFATREDAHRYVAASIRAATLADALPAFAEPLVVTRRNAVFLATAR